MNKELLENAVINYVDDMIEGIHKFYETFNLVYMLRTKEDIEKATGLILPELEVHSLELEEINPNQTELW